MSVNLYKYDLKLNLIKSFPKLISDQIAATYASGIETDGDYLWISCQDSGTYYIFMYDKKGNLVKQFSPSDCSGITTNGKHLIVSKSTANLDFLDKKSSVIRTLGITKIMLGLSFNNEDILAVETGGSNVHSIDQKSGAIKTTVSIASGACTGVASIHDYLAVIVKTGTFLDYINYSSSIIKSFNLGYPAGEIAYDLCHDRDFLWIVTNVSSDIEPPV